VTRAATWFISNGVLLDTRFGPEAFGMALVATIDAGVDGMTEDGIGGTVDDVGDVLRYSSVAADAILVIGNTESLHPRMAGTAGLGVFHIDHGVMPRPLPIIQPVMARLAIVVVLPQVQIMVENDGIPMFGLEADLLCFLLCEQDHREGKGKKNGENDATNHGALLFR
jgi:hypothetical protein